MKAKKPVDSDLGFDWGRLNSALLGMGIALIAAGYLALSRGSVTLAPVLLVLGYVVFVPASLIVRFPHKPAGE